MNAENVVQKILDTTIKITGLPTKNNAIGLHEPSFLNTNSLAYLKDCIDTGWGSSGGEWVNKFEEHLCRYTGASHAVAISNGTDALRLSLHVAGVKKGDEVLVPPISFVATCNAIAHLGASPHFIDVESETLGMSPIALSQRLEKVAIWKGKEIYNKETGKRISAILPVHIFGHPSEICLLKKIAHNWNLPLIEDSAEALGSWRKIQGKFLHCGLFGDLGTLSFNGNKILTTGGGGAIITNNSILAEKAKHISTTAKIPHKWEFDHDQIGWNDRLPNINAALGVAQIEKIEETLSKKRKLAENYKKLFSDIHDVEILDEPKDTVSNFWLITLRITNRDPKDVYSIRNQLLNKGYQIGLLLRPCWKPLHKLKPFLECPRGGLKVAEEQSMRLINLPSSPDLINKKN